MPILPITCTAVRVPVLGGHSESVNLTLSKDCTRKELIEALEAVPGIVIQDEPEKGLYPMPIYSRGKDEVFVGRIRRDFSAPNSWNLWIVADNLRKGAATNAVQIAQHVLQAQGQLS